MAGITEVNSLAARKQALVAECELYRQALGVEIQSLKLSAARVKRSFSFLRLLKPVLLLAPVVGSLIGFRGQSLKREKPTPKGWRKWLGAALVGWRLYRRAMPAISHLISRRNSRARSRQRFGQMTP